MKKIIMNSALFLFFFICPDPTFAFQGRCIKVVDGDTINVWFEKMFFRIRLGIDLYGIDAPEKNQPYGKDAKAFLADRTLKHILNIEWISFGRYLVSKGDICLNQELIKNGLARVDRDNCKKSFCKSWINYEMMAREMNIGLWTAERSSDRH